MTPEERKEFVRRHYERGMNQQDLTALDEDLAPDFVDHDLSPHPARGREAAKAGLAAICRAFPDLQVTIEDMVAEGDTVVVRNTWRGTHLGDFMGATAGGRPVTFTGVAIWRIACGKLAERWLYVDRLGLLQQISASPTLPQAAGARI